jgi:hypothetical protein
MEFCGRSADRCLHRRKARPLTPAESAKAFTVAADLQIDLMLAEPQIAQPVFLNFDERGRLWVVEYRQYPNPAGLKAVSTGRLLPHGL